MKSLLLTIALFVSIVLQAQTFTLRSDELGGQASLRQAANIFGCKGENSSPQLYWVNIPEGTQSFAVTIFDESAPTGSGWWHWLIFDIDKSVRELKSGAGNPLNNVSPAQAIQSKTDFGSAGYGGPCPPPGSGIHRYVITLYALKVSKLGLTADANPALVGYNLEQNVIQKTSLVFYYQQ
ncbi:MAG: YbhB/YbcL family Raf kinase inhibitor-like protein [Chitinophagales bacterium]|nr:YbhB/YbcL family Raf kinase inhibitor-like protein [Chitinophagales bacterium]